MTPSWEWAATRRRREINNPEHIVDVYLKEKFFDVRTGQMKPYTRYRIAKESGVSWHTVNRATGCSGLAYQRKTKRKLKKLLQPIP